MNRKHVLMIILAAALLLSSCAAPEVSTIPPSLQPASEFAVSDTSRPPLILEDDNLYVALIWHQHQPVYYKDPDDGVYERPWVRVHAAKDYVDMVSILREYPLIHATYNLTPSLLLQLDDIAAGARDSYRLVAEIPADELTYQQKQYLLDHFFDINPSIIARFPRYEELAGMRGEEALESWSSHDFRDLQVLFNLAWTDPDWLAEEPLLSLVEKGEGFSEEDKNVVFEEHIRLVKEVVPMHAEMQRTGQIEVTMTPYAHPILPLLVDSDLARQALPDADLPERFVYGQDAVAQVELGVEMYRERFDQDPRGMWPAEGSVAEEVVSMISNAGIEWIATDEDVLADSLPDVTDFTRDSNDTIQQADALYRPYAVQGARGEPVAVMFRDHVLSDRVGFEYSGTPGQEAAADFIQRLENIRIRLEAEDADGPHLVTVLLDGENAWEYYENDGKDFLHSLYTMLSDSDSIVTVTPSEYLDALTDSGMELHGIETLSAGSWIDGSFSTWIGEEEENLAWEYLHRTREALKKAEPELDQEVLEQAKNLMYIAEGSDWFWWYGADQNSGNDGSFDRQFRSYLEQIYRTIGVEVPDFVFVPVIPDSPGDPSGGPAAEPQELLEITVDGRVGENEWNDTGRYDFLSSVVSSLYYGFDQNTLYLRVDAAADIRDGSVFSLYLNTPIPGPANASSRDETGSLLGFGLKQLVEISLQDGESIVEVFQADGEGGWSVIQLDEEARALYEPAEGLMEIALPFNSFAQLRSGDRIHMRLVAEVEEDTAVLPEDGPVLAVVPDMPITNVFLEVEDPPGDDHGPGTYLYPKDAVFKPGVFDITGFTAGFDDEEYIFRIQLRGPVINEWESPNGLSIQTIDIYVDTDGASSGSRMLLPGRNAALVDGFAWDRVVWAEGWFPGVFEPSPEGPVQIDSGFTILTNPGQRRVTVRVPRNLLPGDPGGWSIAVVVLSQEGYPSAGVWRVRDVQPAVEQWRIGGGTGSPADTRIMDVLWPAGSEGSQELLLAHAQAQDVDLDAPDPDAYPQVPMLPQ